MVRESVPEETYREFLRDISSQIDRETRVIDDLLQLALLGRQNDGDEKQSVLLDDIVKQVENNISQAAIQKNISLHLNCQEHCHMYGSRQYLYDIILNLMENAVKYNVPDGKIFLDIKKKNGLLGIRVRDTGIGIGKHTGNDIFKRFYRENSHSFLHFFQFGTWRKRRTACRNGRYGWLAGRPAFSFRRQ